MSLDFQVSTAWWGPKEIPALERRGIRALLGHQEPPGGRGLWGHKAL